MSIDILSHILLIFLVLCAVNVACHYSHNCPGFSINQGGMWTLNLDTGMKHLGRLYLR